MARVVPAVSRAFDILELFLGDRDELTAREITDALGLPRTTVHELTNTLLELGYFTRGTGNRSSFRLGVKVLQLGSAYAERLDLAVEGRSVAEEIVRQCEETAHVAVRDGTDVVYVAKVDSTRSVRMVSAQGRRIPAACTSVGKMLLSALTRDEIDELYREPGSLRRMTPNSISTPAQLKRALAAVRSAGVAFERMESNAEVACVAAGVYDHTAAMVAAMSISVPMVRWADRTEDEWAKLVTVGAQMLSGRLGARPPQAKG